MHHTAAEMSALLREHFGTETVSVAEMGRRFLALGYALDRDMDCRGNARIMTGPLAGRSYPSCTTGLNEADTGLRAWNASARRDASFEAMQALRSSVVAISKGAILQV